LAVAFDDVGGDREGGASQLAAKGYKLSAAYLQRRAMDIKRKRVRFTPDLELLEIAHAQRKRQQSEAATSFRLEGNRSRRELQAVAR